MTQGWAQLGAASLTLLLLQGATRGPSVGDSAHGSGTWTSSSGQVLISHLGDSERRTVCMLARPPVIHMNMKV